MNPKDGFDFNEILWSILDQSRRWAKNYKRDHPLPLSWRPFTVVFLQQKGYYRPSPLAQKASNDIIACGDPITPSNTVKYHSSSNTLISTEQRGGVRNKYMYIRIAFFIEL